MSKWDKLLRKICGLSHELRFEEVCKVRRRRMKTLDEYLSLPYRMEIVEDKTEGGYVASYPDLPGCITCGETIEDVVKNLVEAKKEWLAAAIEDNMEIYEPDSLNDYSGQFKLRIPKSLHRTLVENSKREGISMNQYCVYLLAQNNMMYSKNK